MAMYNVEDKVKKIAEMMGVTPVEAMERMHVYDHFNDGTTVANRGDQAVVNRTLAELEEKAAKAQIREERLAGYRWLKYEGEWVVAGDFGSKDHGDTIIVTKANGERQERRIDYITQEGYAKVF